MNGYEFRIKVSTKFEAHILELFENLITLLHTITNSVRLINPNTDIEVIDWKLVKECVE